MGPAIDRHHFVVGGHLVREFPLQAAPVQQEMNSPPQLPHHASRKMS
jgi:hypothetical protein